MERRLMIPTKNLLEDETKTRRARKRRWWNETRGRD
jgi:hypothetical protein